MSAEDDRAALIARCIIPAPKRVQMPPDPYAGQPCVYEPGICMRWACGGPRWQHPERGELVLCQNHAEEVFRGEARSPPLRPNRDYVASARRTLLVEDIPEKKDPT